MLYFTIQNRLQDRTGKVSEAAGARWRFYLRICSDMFGCVRIILESSVYWRKALRDFLIKSWLWFLEEMSQSCGVFKSLLFAAYIFSWQAQCFVRMSCGLLCLRLCHCDLRFTVCLHPRVDFVASAELWECFLCLVFFWKTVIFRCHCCECGFSSLRSLIAFCCWMVAPRIGVDVHIMVFAVTLDLRRLIVFCILRVAPKHSKSYK